MGLLKCPDQEAWLQRKGIEQHGFRIPHVDGFDPFTSPDALPIPQVTISQEQLLQARQHNGNSIRVFSVRFDGILEVTAPEKFREALAVGIGHGKALGLGLLSVIPLR